MSSASKFGLHSINVKFLCYLIGITIIPAYLILGILEVGHYQNGYSQLIKKLDNLTSSQSLLLAEPLWHQNTAQIGLIAATLIADPDVIAVNIYSADHQRLYHYGDKTLINDKFCRKSSIKYVVNSDVKTIGYVELALSDQHITQNIKQRLYERSLMLAFCLFIIICAYGALQFTVGSALKRLLHSIKLADEEGTLEPVKWDSNDEVGRVVNAYNAMQTRLKQDAIKLRLAYDEQEQRVKDRTHLLTQEVATRKLAESQLRKQEQELQTFLDGVPVMLWMLGPDGKSMHFNESWLKFTGHSYAEEKEHKWDGSDIHPDYRKACIKTYIHNINNKTPFTQEYLKLNGTGKYRWLSEVGTPRFDNQDNYLGYFGTIFDITERKQMEKLLFEEKERAQVTLTSIGEGVISTDDKGMISFINPIAEKLAGTSKQQALAQPLQQIVNLLDEQSRQSIPDIVQSCIKSKQIIGHDSTVILVQPNAHEYFINYSIAPLFNQNKQIIGTVMVFVDITESRQLSLQLSYQASHDQLTGLVNRREFERRVQRVLETAQNTSSEHALCYMDLDQFKIINDTCGHIAGDELLRQLTGLLTHQLRKRDTLARLGGDEFGVLMEHCTLAQATLVAENLCKAVQRYRFQWEGKNFTSGISIGLVSITAKTHDLEQLLIDADSACYVAKSNGRGRVHVYHEQDEIVAKRFGEMQWATRINHALDNNRFKLFYQPIYNSQNGTAKIHCEILVRMIGDNQETILPGQFFPAAERYNLCINIDQWVINKAFSWINALSNRVHTIEQFCINLSGQSLSDAAFMAYVIEQLKIHNINTSSICFEITETAVIENFSGAINAIKELTALGCHFALDDFGSGLSSFAYLKQLPVDYLKIDGLFVKALHKDPIDLEMVRSIHKIGQVMGKKTIAEFVENEAIYKQLQSIGVDYVQGHYLAYPQPIESYLDSLDKQ